MNRSVVWLGISVSLVGVALVAFPLALFGREVLDPEQLSGFLVAPLGLFVVMFGAMFYDPSRTTVGGVFGNRDADYRSPGTRGPIRPPVTAYHPLDPAQCRHCRTHIEPEQATCPRCARPRECRSCGRPLGRVLDRATCPLCARAEPLCNCPRLAPPPAPLDYRSLRQGLAR